MKSGNDILFPAPHAQPKAIPTNPGDGQSTGGGRESERLIRITSINVETVDRVTNAVMDVVREEFRFDPESDFDDRLYTLTHRAVAGELEAFKEEIFLPQPETAPPRVLPFHLKVIPRQTAGSDREAEGESQNPSA